MEPYSSLLVGTSSTRFPVSPGIQLESAQSRGSPAIFPGCSGFRDNFPVVVKAAKLAFANSPEPAVKKQIVPEQGWSSAEHKT